MQQGRPQLDADFNEQVEISRHLDDTRFTDVVGAAAVPGGLGFEVRMTTHRELILSAGRIYVGGLLCELGTETPVSKLCRRLANPTPGRTDLVYLDAWERLVTASDDPGLIDPALGTDTATRLQVVWTLDWVEGVGELSPSDATAALPPRSRGRMTAAAPGGYQGIESQLYRIEIHGPGALGEATFKWSRENGYVVFKIERFVRPNSAVLAPALSNVHKVTVGDWLEIAGDDRELHGLPGTLARVESWAEDSREATFDRDISAHAAEGRPRARPWDGSEGTVTVEASWRELESGIRVRFAGSDFHAGDYWTFPARVAAEQMEWPSRERAQGVEHRFCPLALITWDRTDAPKLRACRDCRPLLVPLTDLYREILHLRAEIAELKQRLKRS
jgi:Family of unknown function (DUF6519)